MRDNPEAERAGAADFNELVARYEKPIFNVIYRILGDYDEAADVTQETFISAYRGFSRFRGDASVYTWLYQIAVNHSRNRLRRRKRPDIAGVESLDAPRSAEGEEVGPREIPDSSSAPHVALEQKEMREKIAAAIEALPPEYREVVVLREMHGMSYAEIVSVTGLSMDNVKTRLSRARAMLRRRLEHYYSPE
ncbi:MAG: sigma-70 family RNA polymerase sigma factor [Chthonomonadales bacterium]|nr:sigma-70 family RNA polymerase sigma factor [Chthonomonadales bacterium]